MEWQEIRKIHSWLPESSAGWHQHKNGGGWVQDTASASDSALVCGSALVYGSALVCGSAQVYDSALVCGSAQVYDSARVYGSAQVCGSAQVYDSALVCGFAQVYGSAHVYGSAQVCGSAQVYDSALVCGFAQVYGSAHVYGSAQVCGSAQVAKTPVWITGLRYNVLICDKLLTIGCQQHAASDWEVFNDDAISNMHNSALKFWSDYKLILLATCKLHQR